MVYKFLIENYYENTFMIFYILNLILIIIAYKLGFARKLPLIKSVFVYLLLAIGTVIISIFSGIVQLPTVESLAIIVLVLAIYRLRLHYERKAKKES